MSSAPPDAPPGGWPRISVIIPVRDLASRLEAAIRSVLDQGYPALELLIADGGSRDGSVAIIERYAASLAWWESAQDGGQSAALNKAFARSTGEWVAWLGGDDLQLPGALAAIGRAARAAPDAALIVGSCRIVEEAQDGRQWVSAPKASDIALMPCANPLPQPAVFVRRSALGRAHLVEPDLHYAMDAELWNHVRSRGGRVVVVDDVVAEFHQRPGNKTGTGGMRIVEELARIYRTYARDRLDWWYLRVRLPIDRLAARSRPWPLRALARPLQAAYTAALAPFYGLGRVRAVSTWSWFLPA